MNLRQNGSWTIKCTFADQIEEVSLKYEHKGNGWYFAELIASQCGCRISAPFIFLEEGLECFITRLSEIENHLSAGSQAAVLYDFTCQNAVVIGPLVLHQRVMFIDIHISLSGPPVWDHLDTFDVDRYEDKHWKVIHELVGYPKFLNLKLADDNVLNLKGKKLLKLCANVDEISKETNVPSVYGTRMSIVGLQFDGVQISNIIQGHVL